MADYPFEGGRDEVGTKVIKTEQSINEIEQAWNEIPLEPSRVVPVEERRAGRDPGCRDPRLRGRAGTGHELRGRGGRTVHPGRVSRCR